MRELGDLFPGSAAEIWREGSTEIFLKIHEHDFTRGYQASYFSIPCERVSEGDGSLTRWGIHQNEILWKTLFPIKW